MNKDSDVKLEDLIEKLIEALVNNTKATYLLRREINSYREFVNNNII